MNIRNTFLTLLYKKGIIPVVLFLIMFQVIITLLFIKWVFIMYVHKDTLTINSYKFYLFLLVELV